MDTGALGLNATDGVMRYPFWITTASHAAAAWLHIPRDGAARPNGVVLCPPFGFEYAHAHRTLVHLADQLAGQGLAVLRIDYPGTGDSSGDETDPDLAGLWLEAIANATGIIAEATGGTPHLVGMRLGALLAGVIASRQAVASYVAWAPITRGRTFAREIRALDLMASETATQSDMLEGGGYRLATRTADDLGALDLAKIESLDVSSCLVVDRTDQPSGARLIARAEELGVRPETIEQADYLDMVAEPHFTTVPHSTIDQIATWLSDRTPGEVAPLHPTTLTLIESAQTATVQTHPRAIVERAVVVPSADGAPLFGILTRPADDEVSDDILLLANAGSAHHIGPNRFYVELARHLAVGGRPSIRFDLRNLGDSRVSLGAPDENHPYPDSATEDVRAMAHWCVQRLGYRCCTLAGLCSGAHTAFHAAHEIADEEIRSVISINPLTYRYTAGMSLQTPSSYRTTQDAIFYQGAILSPERWLRLLRGQSELGKIVGFVSRWAWQSLVSGLRTSGRMVGLLPATPLEQDLAAIERLGRPVHFVFSSTDPGHHVLMREARVTVRRLQRRRTLTISTVHDADHTFSRKADREQAIATIEAVVR